MTLLSRVTLNALVLKVVRPGKLSLAQGHRAFGLRSRHQMHAFFKAHGVDLPLTIEQVRRDSDNALAFDQ